MQSVKTWLARHRRLATGGAAIVTLFVLIFVLSRAATGFVSNVPSAVVETSVPTGHPGGLITSTPAATSNTWLARPPLLVEIAVAVVGGVAAAVLLSVLTYGLRLLSPRWQGLKIRIGSEEFRLDAKGLEQKIIDMQELPRVLLSYSSRDKDFAQRLAEDLRSQGIKVQVWLPYQQTRPGDVIDKEFRQAIKGSQWFLTILSPSALESGWVNKELAFALQAEKARSRALIIPILHKGEEVPPELGDRDYLDFRTDYQGALRQLAERLIASLRRAKKEEVSPLSDDVLLALERGDIDCGTAEGMQQVHSLTKWLQGDSLGWYELWERVRFGDGLHPVVRSALEEELRRIQQGKPRSGVPPGYGERLRSLLSP
jgi:hypothetical protein